MTGSNRPSNQTHAQLIHSIRGWQDVPPSPGDHMNQLRPNKKRQCVATTSSINLFIAYPTRPIFYSNGFENFLLKVSPVEEPPVVQSVAPQSPHLHSEACAQLCWLRFLQHQQHQNHTLAIKQEPVDRPDSRLVLWVLIYHWWFTGVVRTSMTSTNSFACELSSAYSRT